MHSAGATVYLYEERILLSNENDWKRIPIIEREDFLSRVSLLSA